MRDIETIDSNKNPSTLTVTSVAIPVLEGLVATLPFTAVMLGMKFLYRGHGQKPVPPKQITKKIVEKTPVGDDLSEEELNVLTTFSHFGYGGAVGALFSPLSRRFPGDPVIQGMAFGFGVWAVSYVGWLRVFNLQPAVYRQPEGRNTAMILSHLVWGASLGAMQKLKARNKELPCARVSQFST